MMKKKVLICMLAVCVMTGSVLAEAGALTVLAEQTENTNDAKNLTADSYTYQVLEDGSVEITGYQETVDVTEVVVPESIDGKKVTRIGENAFLTCNQINSILIPSGVTTIGSHAFDGCMNLSSVEIPDSVMNIGAYAFYNTKWLKEEQKKNPVVVAGKILIDATTASGDVTIPAGVTDIADYAFQWAGSVNSVTIPNGVRSIGELAFYNCKNISRVTMPDTIVSIGKRAFNGCSRLSSIVIPKGVKKIEYQVFNGCSSVNSITIPNGVTTIEKEAFMGCESLRSISIPRSVISLGDDWFYGCNNLNDIYYMGSEAEWKSIAVFQDHYGKLITVHYASEKARNLRTLNLSKTTVTYTGKEQKPAVVVKDEKGETVNPAHYTVVYSNNKNVGQAMVTVTGKDNYTGKLTAAFTICPKGTKISKVIPKKKAFTVKWKKQTKQTSGYQIQYSTSKKFKGAKRVLVKKNKTTSVTVKNLKAKKKYYIQVRTYKTVKINGKSKKIYSDWSKPKSIKTK